MMSKAETAARPRQRGQALVLFVFLIFVLVGMVAVVIDISWYWTNQLKVQRAADAAALAGVVYLPGDPGTGRSASHAESAKNGYSNGVDGAVVVPNPDPVNTRQMNVTVSAPVETFFMRVFGIDTLTASRRAKAEYVLPVPMGSPQAYYGINELERSGGQSKLPVQRPFGTSVNLNPQGFWAGIFTKGSQRGNGDAYSPMYNGGTNPNVDYDPNGHAYTVEIPSSGGGAVYLFDPAFCATSRNTTGGYYGTGDHWVGGSATVPPAVSTYYRLWDTRNTPFNTDDDVLVADSGTRFENERQVDRSGNYGTGAWGDQNQNPSTSWAPNCSSDPDHNRWWTLRSSLPAGIYRLQVTTTNASNPSINASTIAENMYGIHVRSNSGSPRVYGDGSMVAYTNMGAGQQLFYLAQIDAEHAGKTLIIELFDPGDVGGNAYLRIMKPGATTYSYTSFSYDADNGRSGTNVNSIQTSASGSSRFNNSWITIEIPLPTAYGTGSDDLTPSGETEPGWWKIEYEVQGGNDTTTWRVGVRGNPVHLVVP